MEKYTIQEIDELRYALECFYIYGTYSAPTGTHCSRSYRESEKNAYVEDRVRTLMTAGIRPADLHKENNQ